MLKKRKPVLTKKRYLRIIKLLEKILDQIGQMQNKTG